jgi:hypothetical protein
MVPSESAASLRDALPPPLTVLELLDACNDVCQRLGARWAGHHQDGEPLTGLLHKHTKALEADLHGLKTHISAHRPNANADGSAITELLRTARVRLLELRKLQHFHGCEEQDGHAGALNVLFARRFILGGIARPNAARAYYNEDKLIRIGLELKDLLQQVVPASVRCKAGVWSPDAFHPFL